MKTIILIIMVLFTIATAYTVELDNIGSVNIPDNICDTVLADELTDLYNDYNYRKVMLKFIKQSRGAVFTNLGDPVIAMFNFFNMSDFDTKLIVLDLDRNNKLGIYSPEADIIVINAAYLSMVSRVGLFVTLTHEITHNIQDELRLLDSDSQANIIINEIFADYNAVLSVNVLFGVSVDYLLAFRQPPILLAELYAGESIETAEIIVDAIITNQNKGLIE